MVKSYYQSIGVFMKTSLTISGVIEELKVLEFGTETDARLAHWGRGSRDLYILHYVLKGAGYFNGKRVKAGQGFYIQKRATHEYHSSKSDPWQYFWMVLDGSKVESICKKHINISEDGIFDFSFIPELYDICTSLFPRGERITETRALSYFYLIMSHHQEPSEISGNSYVNEAKSYIGLNLCHAPTVTEIANTLGIDDRYLYNLFKKQEGISPKQYINNRRLTVAKKMLSSGEYTVSEVALSVGFFDPLAFSRFFTKQVGLSPSQYKAQKRSSEAR